MGYSQTANFVLSYSSVESLRDKSFQILEKKVKIGVIIQCFKSKET